jgi:dipeptidyl aminopeptidase/acylaminoacyl peptidase
MNKLLILALLGTQVACAQNQAEVLTVEKIMRDPKWIGTSPSGVFWNFDSKSIFFSWNPQKAPSDSTFQYHLENQQTSKTPFNDALIASAIHRGVYNASQTKKAYILNGDLYLLDVTTVKTTRVTNTQEEEKDPGFSNLGKWVTYKKGNNLFAWEMENGSTIQLTYFVNADSPKQKATSAQEAWLENEQQATSQIIKERKEKRELALKYAYSIKQKDTLRKIYIGEKEVIDLKISPDARFITYLLYELPIGAKTTLVPNYVTETGFTVDIPGRTKVGAPVGKSSFYVFDRKKDTIFKLNTDSLPGLTDLPAFYQEYPEKLRDKKVRTREVFVNDLIWNPEGSKAVVDIRSGDYKDRWIMLLDSQTGKLLNCDHQRDEAWIAGPGIGWQSRVNLNWIDNSRFYFQSEQSGFSQLYSYNTSSGAKRSLTQGNFEVLQATLSADKKYFYLLTNEENPGKQQLYRIKTDGTDKEQITSQIGGYEISVSPDEKFVAYRYSYQNKPWELYLQELGVGKKPVQLTHNAMSEEWRAYRWRDPQIFTFVARDGKPVYARIYEPEASKKNNAAVIFVHGAGYLQNVTYSWSYYYHEYMFNNLLADKGYTVLDIDYRASAGYGRDWRTAIYRHMGGKDLDDELDGAKWLVSQKNIDSTRIGIYGGSYGGFMSLMALFTHPDVFKAGAALRPVTDWAHYNDAYTSAILNEPYNDSLAYQRSSPINFAAGLKNHLLICHGMVDENVHFQDVVRLTQRLIELQKNNWELAVYPVEDHGFVEASSWTDEYKRVLDLFEKYLK